MALQPYATVHVLSFSVVAARACLIEIVCAFIADFSVLLFLSAVKGR